MYSCFLLLTSYLCRSPFISSVLPFHVAELRYFACCSLSLLNKFGNLGETHRRKVSASANKALLFHDTSNFTWIKKKMILVNCLLDSDIYRPHRNFLLLHYKEWLKSMEEWAYNFKPKQIASCEQINLKTRLICALI